MAQVQFAEELIWKLQEKDPRYHARAYLMVLAALNHVMDRLPWASASWR